MRLNLQSVIISVCALLSCHSRASALLISPCPDVLKYLEDTDTEGAWTAEISLSTDDELQGVWLHVVLDRKANTLLNWFGESTTIDNKEFAIRNPQYKLEAGPKVIVKIRALFNSSGTQPSVHRIRLNGRTICASDKPTRTTELPKPFVSLNKPVGIDDGLTESSSNSPHETHDSDSTATERVPSQSWSSGRRTTTERVSSEERTTQNWSVFERTQTQTPQRRRTTERSKPMVHWSSFSTSTTTEGRREFFNGDFSHLISLQSTGGRRGPNPLDQDVQCGKPVKRATPLITKGVTAIEGAWPWHIAIYTSDGLQFQYICGGSLLTKKHILTAAHCVTKPGTNRASDTEGFLIHLGRTHLKRFGRGTQERQIETIKIHPDYNHTYYHNDVAVLVLSEAVSFTDFVRPVCLWNPQQEENIVDQLGTVVGWGFDDNKQLTDTLQETKMPVVDLVKCIYSNRDVFNRFTSTNNFCAGFRNGTSVCNGDSGGGMFFERPVPGGDGTHWELRGMVSVSLVLQNRFCDPFGYTVFTDVLKFYDWIQNNLQ